MRFNDFKIINEAQFNSKQEVIDHFVKQGKSAAAGAAAWERGWRGPTKKAPKPTGPVRSYHDDLDDKRYGETNETVNPHDYDSDEDYHRAVADKKRPKHKNVNDYPYSPEEDEEYFREIFRKKRETAKKEVKESVESLEAQLAEAAIGTSEKRPARKGSRPARGHEPQTRYKKAEYCDACDRPKSQCVCDNELDEARVEYNKKTARMEINNDDADQRHGLYLNGKLVKTYSTKEQAENMKKRTAMYKDATIKKIAEGAKVDRMVKHIKSSEKKLGHSNKEAENIAWATANKRGMLNNKNKKKIKEATGDQNFDSMMHNISNRPAQDDISGDENTHRVAHEFKVEAVHLLTRLQDEYTEIEPATFRTLVDHGKSMADISMEMRKVGLIAGVKLAVEQGLSDYLDDIGDRAGVDLNAIAHSLSEEQFCDECGGSLAEAGKASRSLCVSSKPDSDLGASQLSSCKSQGLRARDGEKSHKVGKTRVTVGGHKIKGRKYGGPLPDWS